MVSTSEKKILDLIIASIEELKDKQEETHDEINKLEVVIRDLINRCTSDTNQRISSMEMNNEKRFSSDREQTKDLVSETKGNIHSELSTFKTDMILQVADLSKKVALINQKVALIVGGISFAIGLFFQLLNWLT